MNKIKIKEKPLEEQRDYLLEQNMLLTGKIATLEKENVIFKKANEIIAQQRDNRDADIAELEKENTELKAFRQDCVKLTEDNVVMARQRAEVARQLTKAKEIIKKLYSHVFQGIGFMELNDYNVQKAEVEQFISEVEK